MESRQRLPTLRVSAYTCFMAPDTRYPGDFYEDDEPVENVIYAFEHGEQGTTAAPTRCFTFTFRLPKIDAPGQQVGDWTSYETPVARDSLANVG